MVYFVGTMVAAPHNFDNHGWQQIKNSDPTPCDSNDAGHVRLSNYQCRSLDNASDGDCMDNICKCFGTSDHGCGPSGQAISVPISLKTYGETC